MRKIILVAVVLIMVCSNASALNTFELRVQSGFQKYAELLALPAFLHLALGNAGIISTTNSKIKIVDEKTITIERSSALPFKNGTLTLREQRGKVLIYEGKLDWGLPKTLTLTAQVDCSRLGNGLITISLSMMDRLPQNISHYLQDKISNYLNEASQARLMGYLEKAQTASPLPHALFFDSYNAHVGQVSHGRRYGDVEPLSDQFFLIITLITWFFIVPVGILAFYFTVRRWKKRMCEGDPKSEHSLVTRAASN
ncbi:MAG: hypothetical protein HY537_13775 [Deltaproteobacteria bacterium]|nr:hypothetical protein [Deltaproteobacteria bacterium]